MQLAKLFTDISILDFQADPEMEVNGLAYSSLEVKPGFLFVAIKGNSQNGHDYMTEAVKNGAVALVGEDFRDIHMQFPRIVVKDSREALSALAANFYDHPNRKINLAGITGTNGKTTTSYILESMLSAAGRMPGIIGTVNYRLPGLTLHAPVTTPESLDLMRILRMMEDNGVTDAVIEVSSHALVQKRTNDCPFRVVIFTNLTRDHLDYHHSMEAYFEAKTLLFRNTSKERPVNFTKAIINTDDPKGKELAKITDFPVLTYGSGKDCDFRAYQLRLTRAGLTARMITPSGEMDIRSQLLGSYNIYNILAASAAAYAMDIEIDIIREGIGNLKSVPGRLELVDPGRLPAVIVDYAHTPDALHKSLTAVKEIVTGKVITVFGCGGDRDRGKRPEMGRIAGENSNIAIITSDNPRTEDPESIIEQVEKGILECGLEKLSNTHNKGSSGYFLEKDRKKAILKAVEIADSKDLILIAGKGHEDYQIVGKEKRHFDDREAAKEALDNFGIQET
ncbi:MAG: UDP-N-acetylmuramoyl-L-alanyl-D-glutamate--2,6-diaminopimelate ligase [Deltaproteobacteria bacterium]|nr:UDP-N-acetylmuramoyl-L-alanyl-D-glutamate--2,6-diaminopimelate ligase [Deltaproteobacteria bacterium]